MKRKELMACIILGTFLILVGCTNKNNNVVNNDYEKFVQEFYSTYLIIIDSIDSMDTAISLKRIHSDENREQVLFLRSLLEKEKSKVPKNMIRHYENLDTWCTDLELLLKTEGEWDSLSFEQRSEAFNAVALLDMHRQSIEEDNASKQRLLY